MNVGFCCGLAEFLCAAGIVKRSLYLWAAVLSVNRCYQACYAISFRAALLCHSPAMAVHSLPAFDSERQSKYYGPECLLGPFHGAIAIPSVTRCRCRRRRRCGHRCAGGMRQYSGDTW